MIIREIGVVGAGQMGSGIAQVAAQSGYKVAIYDSFPGSRDKSRGGIEKSLAKLKEKNLIKEEPKAVMERIVYVNALQDFGQRGVNFVIEAVTEDIKLKREIFTTLNPLLDADAVYTSNTSSISITEMAASLKKPERFMGMHFMNPVPLMTLVELIRGLATSDDTYKTVRSVAEKMGKTCIVAQDRAGFVINRILMPLINEAIFALDEGLASKEDIDTGMKLGTNQPMGPLTLADFVGLDTCLYIMEVLHDYLGDDKYRPCPLLRKYVQAGWHGKKSGRGFYEYK